MKGRCLPKSALPEVHIFSAVAIDVIAAEVSLVTAITCPFRQMLIFKTEIYNKKIKLQVSL